MWIHILIILLTQMHSKESLSLEQPIIIIIMADIWILYIKDKKTPVGLDLLQMLKERSFYSFGLIVSLF